MGAGHPGGRSADPLAYAAWDLLTSGPLNRVKRCPACPWLYLDQSKNGSRRWCTMEDCGKAVKMRRYVAKRAAARQAALSSVLTYIRLASIESLGMEALDILGDPVRRRILELLAAG